MTSFSQIQPINLRDRVVEQIRTAIIEGHLRPNDHIAEAGLTRKLGVSRTPVREALILLEREGLVVSLPNRGSTVRVFTDKDVVSIFAMRTTLENFAAELLLAEFSRADHDHLEKLIEEQSRHIDGGNFKDVRSTDMSFHQHLIERANNPLLLRSWSELVAQIAAILYLRAEAVPNYDEYRAISDHRTILEAYLQGDLEAVKEQNRRVNARVSNECCSALQKLDALSR